MRRASVINYCKRAAFWEQEGRCFYCDVQMLWGHDRAVKARPNQLATAEHLLPQSRQGLHTRENIVAACHGCNQARRDKPLWDWVSALQRRLDTPHIALLLRKLAKRGIKPPIGHPALAAPTVDNPIVRAPEVAKPAP